MHEFPHKNSLIILNGNIINIIIGGVSKMTGEFERKIGERNKLPTKLLEKEETLPANTLRNISQKSLLEMVNNFEKLGLIVNNNLSVAMLSWDKYENLVDMIQSQLDRINELEGMLEDLQLAEIYGEDVLRVEKSKNTSFEIDSAEELFKMLD